MPEYRVRIGPVEEVIQSALPDAAAVKAAIETGTLKSDYWSLGCHVDVAEVG
jgi:hypothetical protein